MWVSETATHFKSGLLTTMLAEAFGVDQHFAVTHSARTNDTVEWYDKEFSRTEKGVLSESRRKASAWAQVVPMM